MSTKSIKIQKKNVTVVIVADCSVSLPSCQVVKTLKIQYPVDISSSNVLKVISIGHFEHLFGIVQNFVVVSMNSFVLLIVQMQLSSQILRFYSLQMCSIDRAKRTKCGSALCTMEFT